MDEPLKQDGDAHASRSTCKHAYSVGKDVSQKDRCGGVVQGHGTTRAPPIAQWMDAPGMKESSFQGRGEG